MGEGLQFIPEDRRRSFKTSAVVCLAALIVIIIIGLAHQDKKTPAVFATPDAAPTAAWHPPQNLEGPPGTQHSVLHEAWPPPPNAAVRNESTFLMRIPGMLLMLAIMCGIIWGLLKVSGPLLNKLTGQKTSKNLSVIERKQLGPGKQIMIVEASGRRFLLGMTDKSITNLAELDPEDQSGAGDEAEHKQEDKNLVQEVIDKHISSLPVPKLSKEV
ncbi:MAG: flagellar biosynthetic protein FliO [bacterium]|nr:flagellar biosynthetic protein FliO [bacterium]